MPSRIPSVQAAFGARVRALRQDAGVTQEELAERCGLFRTYLSRIENGSANPTLTMIHALSISLNVGIPALFDPANSVVEASTRGRPTKVKSAPGNSRGRVR